MDITLERILSLIPQKENGRFIRGAAADFAKKINVAPNLLTEWKSGRNKSYRTKLREISDAYDVSVDWLLGNTDEKKSDKLSERETDYKDIEPREIGNPSMDITLERILSLIPHKPNGDFVHGAKKVFAKNLGYDGGDIITLWEKGLNYSYRKRLYQIAVKYDVSVEWLKGETDEKKPSAIVANEKTKLIASLEYMSKEELLDLITKALGILRER